MSELFQKPQGKLSEKCFAEPHASTPCILNSQRVTVLFLFPGIFPDLGLRLLVSFQLGFLSFHACSCAHGWLPWNRLVTSLSNSSDLREAERWKEKHEWRESWERHPLPACSFSPNLPADPQSCCRHGWQGGCISIPSWFTCFLQILQLHCRQINAVICFQQGGGNSLWHFLFLNNWSCFVFPKPYWSTRLMIVFLKALFCSLCHRGSPGNYN